jgi:hypothetical protein
MTRPDQEAMAKKFSKFNHPNCLNCTKLFCIDLMHNRVYDNMITRLLFGERLLDWGIYMGFMHRELFAT